MKSNFYFRKSVIMATGLLLSTAASQAALYHIDIATSALSSSLSGPFSLDFQLNSGDTLGNNTAVISNFTFLGGGGSPFGSSFTLGGASGGLDTQVTLMDSSAFNEFFQSFTAGDSFSFDLSLTQNVDSGLTPDAFSFSILDNNLFSIPTTGFADTLIFANIDTTNPLTAGQLNPAGGTGQYTGVRARIQTTASNVPDAGSTIVLLGFALIGLAGFSQKSRTPGKLLS